MTAGDYLDLPLVPGGSDAEEAIETVEALRNAEVDAIVSPRGGTTRIYTLAGADTPYRLFVEAMGEGAVTLDRSGTVLYCNARFAQLLATPSERIIGSSFSRWLHRDCTGALESLLQLREPTSRTEAKALSGDGRVVPLRLSATALTSNDLDVVCVLATDLTDATRRLAEIERTQVALRHANIQMKALLRASQAIARLGPDLTQVVEGIADTARKHLGGCCVVAFTGTHGCVPVLARSGPIPACGAGPTCPLKPDAATDDGAWFRHCMEIGHTLSTPPRAPTGDLAPFESSARMGPGGKGCNAVVVPLRASGEAIGALGVCRSGRNTRFSKGELSLLLDISARASLALRNAKLYGDLKNALREQQEYEQTRLALIQQDLEQRARIEYLQQLDDLKISFLNAASHELRTPLSSIVGYAEFLEDEIAGDLNEEQRGFVKEIVEGANRMTRLVDDLLDFARLEAGTFKISLQEVDLLTVVERAIRSLGPQVLGSGLTLDLDMPDAPVNVVVDPARIEQVILNLVGNAIKFTNEGGTVGLKLSQSSDDVLLEVRDTGIGIDVPHLAAVFEKFFQVDSSLTRTRGGAGLGLAIARALVQAHSGRIGADSVPGEGSTFWFSIPRAAPATAEYEDTGEPA